MRDHEQVRDLTICHLYIWDMHRLEIQWCILITHAAGQCPRVPVLDNTVVSTDTGQELTHTDELLCCTYQELLLRLSIRLTCYDHKALVNCIR